MSLPSRLLGANPSIQVSTLLSGSLSTPSAKGAFIPNESIEYIASITGSDSSSTMTFNSIPQTYKHLVIRGIMNSNYSGPQAGAVGVQFNGDTGSNYTRHLFSGINTGNISGAAINATPFAQSATNLLTSTANITHGMFVITISNYTSRSFYAISSGFAGLKYSTTDGETGVFSGAWNNTANITSISLYQQNGNIFSNSVAQIYGIKG